MCLGHFSGPLAISLIPSLFTSIWAVENAALIASKLSVPLVPPSSLVVLLSQPSIAAQSLWDKAALVGGASKAAVACPQELISAEILWFPQAPSAPAQPLPLLLLSLLLPLGQNVPAVDG